MPRIRLYSDQEMQSGSLLKLTGPPAHHLLKVLRRRVGDHLVVFNGNGEDHFGEITSIDGRDNCSIQLLETRRPPTESPLKVTLIQAIGRGDRMDWALQKSVELGVHQIQPIMSERTEVRLTGARAEKRQSHWQKVVISACEQSGRVRIPQVDSVVQLIDLTPPAGIGLFLDPDADQTLADLDIGAAKASEATAEQSMALAVGPEGGFSELEIKQLSTLGFTGLRLGPRVLRTETAGPAALAILQSHFGDC